MIVRKIYSNEFMETRNISSLCFHWSHDTQGVTPEEYFEREMSEPLTEHSAYWVNTWASFTEDNEMMGCLSIKDFDVEFDGHSYKMGGIAGVCTYPQFRRQGVIREIFKKAIPDLYEKGYTFSYLYAFSEAFYRRYGYEPTCYSKGWTFQMHTIPTTLYDGTFSLYRKEDDLKDFELAYERFASQYNMCVHRCEYDWRAVKDANPFKGEKSAFLYRNKDGNPTGYLVFQKIEEEGVRIFHCNELIFDCFDTLKALLSFAKSFQSDYDVVRFRAPGNLDLRYFCTDYSQSKSKIEEFQNGMARVVNVKKALEGAKYKGNGKVKIRIQDMIINENTKDYSIEFVDNRCSSIQENPINTSESVDISMSINQFSAAILGMYDVAAFEYMDFTECYTNIEELKKIFYKKGCWIHNFF